MKLTLPVYGRFCCGDDVAMLIQLIGENDWIVIKCKEHEQVWGENGVYSTFGLIEFDTNDLVIESSNVFSRPNPCVKYDNIKFTIKTKEEMKDWFYEHYKCFIVE